MDMFKSLLYKHFRVNTRQRLRRVFFGLIDCAEYVVFGGRLRERLLVKLLEKHYNSKFRRDWIYSDELPHFFDHRMDIFRFAYGKPATGPYFLFRGFFASDILRDGDWLLDIGCGDGFFTKRFFATRSAHIDAIDIDSAAIRLAIANNNAPNISYFLLDSVNQPFPNDRYDVIVWDGGIGHLSTDVCMQVLEKLGKVLSPDGVFVGSESLGKEGADHLQFFSSLNDLYSLFKPYFEHTELRCLNYSIGMKRKTIRQEAYWRCYNNPERVQACRWREHLPDVNVSSGG